MSQLQSDLLGQLAYEKLRQMILDHQLQPGEKIVQEKVAAELGISRTPLRVALQMLEAEYLVTSIPRKGVVVNHFSPAQILEIYECRIALECTAIRAFTRQASSRQLAELASFFQSFVDLQEPIEYRAYQLVDTQFHDFFISHCGNAFLAQLFHGGNLLLCIDRIGLLRPPEETLPEHLAIIEAVSARDAELAEARLRDHLHRSQVMIQAKIPPPQ